MFHFAEQEVKGTINQADHSAGCRTQFYWLLCQCQSSGLQKLIVAFCSLLMARKSETEHTRPALPKMDVTRFGSEWTVTTYAGDVYQFGRHHYIVWFFFLKLQWILISWRHLPSWRNLPVWLTSLVWLCQVGVTSHKLKKFSSLADITSVTLSSYSEFS